MHAIINVQLIMRSARYLLIRKLVHVLQASGPSIQSRYVQLTTSSTGPSLSRVLEIPVLLISFIACHLDELWL